MSKFFNRKTFLCRMASLLSESSQNAVRDILARGVVVKIGGGVERIQYYVRAHDEIIKRRISDLEHEISNVPFGNLISISQACVDADLVYEFEFRNEVYQ